MTLQAALVFSGWHWRWAALAGLALGLVLLAWSYRSAGRLGPYRWLALLLKTLGLAALLFCLLEPFWSSQRAKPGANLCLIVADNSQGLQIHDRGASRSRGEQLREWLDPVQQTWPARLAEQFETRLFSFDARVQTLEAPAQLRFDGPATALNHALRALAERFNGRPVAGLLLFTDGNATDLGNEALDTAGLPPVFPVLVGQEAPIPDLAVEQVHVTQSAFEDAPVSVQAEVRAAGFSGESVTARLLDRAGKLALEQTLPAPRDDAALAFRFQFRPRETNVAFYQLRVARQGEFTTNPPTRATVEATLANNQSVLVVDRGGGPYRVLYVGGRPNWDYRYLNRALAEDEQIQLVGLIRVARREPKFEFRGRAGETSNPLFRGFGNQSREETERYDQPVLVRLNTRDELELRSGFPQTAEDLYGYHAVILDDVEAEFFSPEQALLVQKFVSERGGGFLMCGGADSFASGQYARNPIGDLLPVYLEHAEALKPPARLRLNLTREGLLQPWVRLRELETDERVRLEGMPPFLVLNPARDTKPAAHVLATVTGETGASYPALVVQRFGRGRAAALTIGDLWRWGLRDAESRRDLDKAWRQVARWLVADVPKRVDLQASRHPGDPHQAVQLQVRVRDAKFQPLDEVSITLDVEPVLAASTNAGATNRVRLFPEPAPREPGLFQATFVPRFAGGFLARAIVTHATGVEVGRAEAGWSSDPAAAEFRSVQPNRALLETLAQKTGGRVVPAAGLDEFARSLPRRQAPVMEAWSQPFWHTPAMFAFALTCLILEWGLRRWKGLP